MNENKIRIIKLGPMSVASAYTFGGTPEEKAFEKMYEFAKENGLLLDGQLPPTFGFNNPNPSAGSPNYGYEVWLPLDGEFKAWEGVNSIDFPGGLYAVGLCHGLQNIAKDWLDLARWREGSKYLAGKHQWLEHLLSPQDAAPDQYEFELYLPIAE
ncbi:MAG: effector binding domain-containing protein [Candidatus Promineifilaceae bacterium]